MKKFLSLLLVSVMCMSIVACSGANSSLEPQKPWLDVEQELINICCAYSGCSYIKGFNIGTKSLTETDSGYKVKAKGHYWPTDEYGDIGNVMTFDIEFTATWDGKSSFYNISVDKRDIKIKY